MGIKAYIVSYEECRLGGGSDFYEILEKHFTNDEGEVYIDIERWKEFIEEHKDVIEKFKTEVSEVWLDLYANNGCVSYAFF